MVQLNMCNTDSNCHVSRVLLDCVVHCYMEYQSDV